MSSGDWVANMKDSTLVSTDVLLEKPKKFVHEKLRMPDGQEIDWYYVHSAPSVMVVPVTAEGDVILVKQYRHNLKRDTLELPAGVTEEGEDPRDAALRELVEETGHVMAEGAEIQPLGPYYALPSETDKYVHFYLAAPVVSAGAPQGDTEIEKYFDMSVVVMPFDEAISALGRTIHGLETLGGLLLARQALEARR
ncbi:hypothetical protein GCM10018962_21680 [Dactylosporangium matsuzakiense]|uniref:Nudix hydrolase domain-containing protein n=2 Tax=Dactylosporangium matsuzakiense TaxID=53360 RepID=A0A9W6KEU7_9ACTN|nr:hypothetical protein GCM10017581_025080 [Dactylosporangium matsuzakiense]